MYNIGAVVVRGHILGAAAVSPAAGRVVWENTTSRIENSITGCSAVGSAVPVSETGHTETSESLAAPALAGFEQPVKTGGKSALTT